MTYRIIADPARAGEWFHETVSDRPVDFDVIDVRLADDIAIVTLRKKKFIGEQRQEARPDRMLAMKLLTRTTYPPDPGCIHCGPQGTQRPGAIWKGGQGGDWEPCECVTRPRLAPEATRAAFFAALPTEFTEQLPAAFTALPDTEANRRAEAMADVAHASGYLASDQH